ncbi:hypothetical protein BSL82_04975 [Tardibacter chloracetimidivorans]|uniref:Uncharacterized protein n=1 Tax=Tardibacter chloracetimidivorans TaxID=1921510 RepID=A0A1L3ZSZ8_9SPHN|nr:hypothetical protein [Tardibacter chloracetimidivorans]API58747.1 hypothetical protein BSL82_04975 [Tardibacter chloracetimidivorans]
MIDLADRRMALSVELDELEAAQGAAVLDGKPFDPATISAKRSELAAIDAAEAENTRRERVAAAAVQAERRAAIRDEMKVSLAGYEDALVRAQRAAKALAEAVGDARTRARELNRQAGSYGMKTPVAVDPHNVETVLSRLIAGELLPVASPSGFGVMSWISVPSPEWSTEYEKSIRPVFQAVIEEN